MCMEKIVCWLCHKLKATGAEWCKFCPGETVEEVIGGQRVRKIVQRK